mmetsp:Transcript_10855/g.11654  ORF Transcript_10855/g.11654 Transcript_10855/m.11654 type:complete len:573 (+) Transcript_10855:64-1782(+)
MGFINNTFTKIQTKTEENKSTFNNIKIKTEENFTAIKSKAQEFKVKNTKTTKPTDATTTTSTTSTTSWEQSIANIDVIVTEVGHGRDVDIVCVNGKGGKPTLGATMEKVLIDAFEKDLTKKSVSVLVLTTGRKPDDASLLEKSLLDAAKKVAKIGAKEPPLSVTFIQVDEDQRVGAYLKQLERIMAGERIQIVDTMTDVEIISTMKEINKSTTSNSKTGLIAGGLAGAAISAGGMYAYNKHQEAKKTCRKNDFNGQFKCFYDDEEITTLNVTDDQKGNLTIEGFYEEVTVSGKYSGFHEKMIMKKESAIKKGRNPSNEDIDIEVDEKIHVHEVFKKPSGEEIDIDIDVKIDMKEKATAVGTNQKAQRLDEVDVETEVFICFTNPSGELIEGTYMEEERIINWSDGSRWEADASSEEGRINNTKLVTGAAVVGAIAAGTTGYMMDKKFFSKVSKKDQCDYIIIVDRSATGAPHNKCATTEEIDIEIHEETHLHEDIIKKKESANKTGQTSCKEDIDIEVDEKIHVHEVSKKSSGGKMKRTKEEIDIEIDVKIDVKEKVTVTKQKTQIPAYLRK